MDVWYTYQQKSTIKKNKTWIRKQTCPLKNDGWKKIAFPFENGPFSEDIRYFLGGSICT